MSPATPPAATLDDAPAPTSPGGSPGQRLLAGRYAVHGRIGAGGMATILRGWDTSLDRPVAIKVLHAHLADDPTVLARFRTEARHAARLNHPHIVAVYDQGVADLPYIVLELIEGCSLREVLVRSGPLSPSEALAVVVPVCSALQRAHDAGVIHRDVKPENVLVSSDGIVKVADFGVARALAATSHTATGTLVGSVHYLAPELVDGREADPRSDQYAVGVLLFELLTGRKPLPADTPMAVALRHANEDVPAPSRYAPEVSHGLDRVVRRATERHPHRRYDSVAELAAALQEAVPGGSAPITVADADGRERTLVLPAERQDTAATVVAAELDARRRPPDRSGRRRRVRRGVAGAALGLLLLALLAGGGYLVWDRVLAPVQDVPGVVGLDRSSAFTALEELGLDLVVAEEAHDLSLPAGAVLEQDPAAGSPLRRGGVVRVIVSTGPRIVELPDVVGRTQEEALARLGEHAFAVEVGEEFDDTAPRGTVIGQLPDPGTPVPEGSQVLVAVSLGIEQVEVPDLQGLSRGEAASALVDAKLEGAFVEEWSDEVPEEHAVVSQSTPARTTVDKGTVVEVVVSRGPLTVPMPDLRGEPADEARATLEDMALVVEGVTQPVPRIFGVPYGRPGFVEQQDPAPGTPIERGSTVVLRWFTAE